MERAALRVDPEVDLGEHRDCLIRDILSRVGDKWSLSVIHQLGDGRRRFRELHRGIAGISERMLTVTLRTLERDGLLTRTVFPVVPPRVEYELTSAGRSLLATVAALFDWCVEHAADISTARSNYDAANPAA